MAFKEPPAPSNHNTDLLKMADGAQMKGVLLRTCSLQGSVSVAGHASLLFELDTLPSVGAFLPLFPGVWVGSAVANRLLVPLGVLARLTLEALSCRSLPETVLVVSCDLFCFLVEQQTRQRIILIGLMTSWISFKPPSED